MKLLLFGSGEFALPSFKALAQKHDIAAVITQPDKPAGRKRKLTPTPVGRWAQDFGLPTHKFTDVNTPDPIQQIADYHADFSVVIAFGQKLSPELIAAMGTLAVNLHASILPNYRGAAPINWAVINADKTTGLTVIALAQRMDAGHVYATAVTDIAPNETAGELHDRLAKLGPDLLLDVLDKFQAGALQPQPQDDTQATRAPKLSRDQATVDFSQPAPVVAARIRGLTPWPGVNVTMHLPATHNAAASSEQLKLRRAIPTDIPPPQLADARPGQILDHPDHPSHTDRRWIACGQGAIELLEVQRPGGRPMSVAQYLNGHPLPAGAQFENR